MNCHQLSSTNQTAGSGQLAMPYKELEIQMPGSNISHENKEEGEIT